MPVMGSIEYIEQCVTYPIGTAMLNKCDVVMSCYDSSCTRPSRRDALVGQRAA